MEARLDLTFGGSSAGCQSFSVVPLLYPLHSRRVHTGEMFQYDIVSDIRYDYNRASSAIRCDCVRRDETEEERMVLHSSLSRVETVRSATASLD